MVTDGDMLSVIPKPKKDIQRTQELLQGRRGRGQAQPCRGQRNKEVLGDKGVRGWAAEGLLCGPLVAVEHVTHG